ncbi:unnamed protein product, partial [Timema podura]|nr:unnamed protein product [Timema podura]
MLQRREVFYRVYFVSIVTYAAETWTLNVRETRKVEATGLKFVRRFLAVTSRNKIRNEVIRKLVEVQRVHEILEEARKLVTSGIPAGHFSHVFIDEGGHAVEPEVLVPIAGILTTEGHRGTFAGQLVIAGDPKQLGPIIRSTVANKMGLGRSFLERLMDEVDLYSRDEETDAYDTAVITKLIKNFRSHKDILNISNSLFYHKELKVCGGPEITLACNWPELPKKGFPIIFHGIVG